MANRVTSDDVQEILEDYDSTKLLTPHISLANAITDDIDEADTDGILSTTLLTHIEKLLAAHFYASLSDRPFKSNSTDGASATYFGDGKGLEETQYGRQALRLDRTGYLAAMNQPRQKASARWLGKRPSNQTDYQDRD